MNTSASNHKATDATGLGNPLWYAALLLMIVAVSTDRYGLRVGGTNLRFELLVAGLLALAVLIRQRVAVLRVVGLIEACLIGWLAVSFVSSALFSPARGTSLKQTILLAGLLSAYGVTVVLIRSRPTLALAAAAWIAMGALVALIGVLAAGGYVLFHSLAGISLEGSGSSAAPLLLPKVNGTMWEPDIFGSYLLTVWALAFFVGFDALRAGPGRARLSWLAMLLTSAGVVISLSRIDLLLLLVLPIAAVAVAVRLGLARSGDAWRRLVPTAIGVGLGVALGLAMQVESCVANPATSATAVAAPAVDLSGPPPQTITYGGCVDHGSALVQVVKNAIAPATSSSVTGRTSNLRAALNGWLRRPVLGWGTNAFALVYGPAGGSWIGNLELHVLFDSGIVGFLLVLTAGLVAARRALGALARPAVERGGDQMTILGCTAGVGALLIAYQFTDGTWLGFTWVLFGMLVAATRVVQQQSEASVERDVSSSPASASRDGESVPVTIAIVNWNSGQDLVKCVSAVITNTRIGWTLIVVDNASTDDSLSGIDESDDRIQVVRSNRNLGYAGGVNLALKRVATPLVLLLNPDAFVAENCVDELVARAAEVAHAAVVGASLRNSDGSLQAAVRNFPSPVTHLIEAFRLYRVLRFVPGLGHWYLLLSNQRQARRVDWVVGACMLVRMDAVRDVGPLDDSYFMYSEEMDWCLRASRKGWEIWFEPKAVATHRLGGSSRQNELPLLVESYRSMYRFYAKYYPPSWTAAARAITWAAMMMRVLLLPFRRNRSQSRLAAYREIARL